MGRGVRGGGGGALGLLQWLGRAGGRLHWERDVGGSNVGNFHVGEFALVEVMGRLELLLEGDDLGSQFVHKLHQTQRISN